MSDVLHAIATAWLADFRLFSRLVAPRPLYAYQLAPARAILDSVFHHRGLEFVVMFPRQAGKNETQAQLEAYLLNVFRHVPGAQIVKAQPTFKPQAQNARGRLEQMLTNPWDKGEWKRSPDYLVKLGQAACAFYSAAPDANVVGATATLLLACDEAQEVQAEVWERKFVPMTLSTNATTVLWGTAWTPHTLLARAMRHLRALEAQDGVQRVFVVDHDTVAAENPAYAEGVRKAVARLGRHHPLIKTQYFNEEIAAEGGLFPADRRARMQGRHAPLPGPRPLGPAPSAEQPAALPPYAFLLDIGGEDHAPTQLTLAGFERPAPRRFDGSRFDGPRDATALTIVEVDLSTIAHPLLAAPTYRVVHRRQWVGVSHRQQLEPELLALLAHWQPAYVVADATGLGHGTASLLRARLPEKTFLPVVLNAKTKSDLGWGFLSLCDAGRWQEWQSDLGSQPSDSAEHPHPLPGVLQPPTSDLQPPVSSLQPPASTLQPPASDLQPLFWLQLAHVQYEIRPGPERTLAWGVPDGVRHPVTHGHLHDDLVLSAALAAVLDRQPWHVPTGPGVILQGRDPLEELSQGF